MNGLSGDSGGGFTTTVHPATSAGASFQLASVTGAFHGMMAPTTPTGSPTTSPADGPLTTWRSNGYVRASPA